MTTLVTPTNRRPYQRFNRSQTFERDMRIFNGWKSDTPLHVLAESEGLTTPAAHYAVKRILSRQRSEMMHTVIYDAIAELGRRRVELNLSQQELADRLGVRQATICAWECGHYLPTLTKFAAWVAALGLKLSIGLSDHE